MMKTFKAIFSGPVEMKDYNTKQTRSSQISIKPWALSSYVDAINDNMKPFQKSKVCINNNAYLRNPLGNIDNTYV